jgi:hypothetical protein
MIFSVLMYFTDDIRKMLNLDEITGEPLTL